MTIIMKPVSVSLCYCWCSAISCLWTMTIIVSTTGIVTVTAGYYNTPSSSCSAAAGAVGVLVPKQKQFWNRLPSHLFLLLLDDNNHNHNHHNYNNYDRARSKSSASTYMRRRRRHHGPSSIMIRNMAVTLPESLFEETSTRDLLDQILDESLRTSARKPIMIQFDPSSGAAIWRRWEGTIFSQTWRSILKHVGFAVAVYVLFQNKPHIKMFFQGYDKVWTQSLSITTFTLTFFVNQAYSLWRKCMTLSRKLQGHLNDLLFMATGCAKRKDTTTTTTMTSTTDGSSSSSSSSQYATASQQLLLVIARYIRLFNILSYASFARSHRPLVTPRGIRRLVARGLLTEKERNALLNCDPYVTATQRHNVVLQWILRALLEATRAGHFDEATFPRVVASKTLEIRSEANSMEGILRGRMPFAYAHTVQVLIDSMLWMYPVMAFSQGLSVQMGVFGAGFLTLCYQGLFDLAKCFLDPFHNENFWSGNDILVVDTLIAETNAGSLRWVFGLENMPISSQTMKKGNFEDFLLPNEGYTTEEAQQIKEAREAKEAALATKLTVQEVEARAAEVLETAKQEYEETKLIMETPAGYEFVPGLDDEGESLEYLKQQRNSTALLGGGGGTTTKKELGDDNFVDAPSDEKYDNFLEAVEEDYGSIAMEE